MTVTIAQRARKKYGLKREQLILNASHNHSGPVTGDVLRTSMVRLKPSGRPASENVAAIWQASRGFPVEVPRVSVPAK
jgi:hypothetical protein